MKKKLLSLLLVAAMTVAVAGCAKPSAGTDGGDAAKEEGSADGGYELALVTDVGTIDDKSFNQGAWEGLVKYAEENNVTHKYYQPKEKSTEACLEAIDLAVKGGAKVIVTPGFLFEEPIYEAQTKYPDTHFIILDAAPGKGGEYKTESNVASIFYAEQQAGYLAGYAAVVDGYKKLGFMGGIAVPAVVRFGYGFIQGADAAAKDLGIAKDEISVKYTYVGNFDASPENQTLASSWFNEGIECIFACGGGVGNSVMKAAEQAGTVVIGVDVDQSFESDTVITSAMKNLGSSVYNEIKNHYDGCFDGGKSTVLDAASDGIQLPMETSKFKTFAQADYDKLYSGLKDGSIKVEDDTVAEKASAVPVEFVKVELVE